jgi:hypothetical protein
MKMCEGLEVYEYIRIHLVRTETGEHGNKYSGSTKCWKFPDYLRNSYFKKGS